jgi:hypothetical protein
MIVNERNIEMGKIAGLNAEQLAEFYARCAGFRGVSALLGVLGVAA